MVLSMFTYRLLFLFVALALIAYWSVLSAKQSANINIVNASEVSQNTRGERVYKEHLFTGEMRTYHPNGKIATADQFIDGRRHGFSKKWFQSGILAFESNYVSGVREGLIGSWWFNGLPRSQTFYQEGKAQGEAWRWYRDGTPFKKLNFVDGQLKGLQQGWRKNGKLYSNFEYRDGRIYGLKKANTCVGLEDEAISVGYYKNQEEGLIANES